MKLCYALFDSCMLTKQQLSRYFDKKCCQNEIIYQWLAAPGSCLLTSGCFVLNVAFHSVGYNYNNIIIIGYIIIMSGKQIAVVW